MAVIVVRRTPKSSLQELWKYFPPRLPVMTVGVLPCVSLCFIGCGQVAAKAEVKLGVQAEDLC